MPDFAIGVDMGGTNLRIAAVDEHGRLIEKVTLGTRIALGSARVLDDMCDAIRRLCDKYQNGTNLLGIGIGVPGIIDVETGLIRESANLPGWSDTAVRAEIERRLATRVILENDANCAAFGETWLGSARDVADMAIITLGTGVGGGIILKGRIWHGMTGMAGEFGHTTIEPNGPLCGCGNRGCVEQYASASAIMRMAREAIAAGQAPALAKAADSDSGFSAKTVYTLAVQGDIEARRIFQQVGRALGILLANIVNSLNLPMYVVGGGASSAWDMFSPNIFKELRDRSMVYVATAPPDPADIQDAAKANKAGRYTIITRAQLGSDAGLYGASRLPMVDAY